MNKILAGIGMAFCVAGSAQAAITGLGAGMLYDDVHRITWTSLWNPGGYTKPSDCYACDWMDTIGIGYTAPGVNPDGSMTWQAAKTWAENLEYNGYKDWRLPTREEFLAFRNTRPGACFDNNSHCNAESPPLSSPAYWWTATESNLNNAFVFGPYSSGAFSSVGKELAFFTAAVRDGESGMAPAPASFALLVLGLAGIGAARRKQA